MSSRNVVAILIACVLLTACAFRGAYTAERVPTSGPTRVEASPTEVGRVWSYRLVNGFNSEVVGQYREELIERSAAGLSIVRTDPKHSVSITEKYTLDWKWISKARPGFDVLEYSPPLEAIPFPLEIGKSWRYQAVSDNRFTGERYPVNIHGRVVGWEKIQTPSGSYDAVRIDRVIYVDDEDTWRTQTRFRESDWYVPAVGRIVRSENTSGYYTKYAVEDGGIQYFPGSWNVLELIDPMAMQKQ